MRRLSKESPLFRHAQSILENLPEWQQNEAYLTASEDLAGALRRGSFQADVFDAPNFPIYALMAYEKGGISERQFSSMLLYWSAKKDYSDFPSEGLENKHSQTTQRNKFTVYELTPENGLAKRALADFLTIEAGQAGGLVNAVAPEEIDQLIAKLQSDDIPRSERCFIEIEIKESAIQPILKRILEIGFTLFMPIKTDSGYRVIIPSFTLIQATFDQLKPEGMDGVTSIPVIGDCSAMDVQRFHVANQHPLGLSFPGFEQSMADGFKSGCYGFSLHDVYHPTLLMHIPNRDLINHVVTLGNQFLALKEDNVFQKNALSTCVNGLIDAELRQYVSNRSNKDQRKPLIIPLVIDPAKPGVSFIQLMVHMMRLLAASSNESAQIKDDELNEIAKFLQGNVASLPEKLKLLKEALTSIIPTETLREEIFQQLEEMAQGGASSVTNIKKLFAQSIEEAQEQLKELTHSFTQFIIADLVNRHVYWKEQLGIDICVLLDQINNNDNAVENFFMIMDMREKENQDPLIKFFERGDPVEVTYKKALRHLHTTFLEMIAPEDEASSTLLADRSFNETGSQYIREYQQRREQLFAFSKDGNSAGLADLLENNPTLNVNQCDPENKSPLHWAAERGHVDVVKQLLAHPGATIDLKLGPVTCDKDSIDVVIFGTTPLHVAAAHQQVAVMNFLLDHGADISSPDPEKQTALVISIKNGCVKGLKLLLQRTFINQKDIKALRDSGYIHANCEHLLKRYLQFQDSYKTALNGGIKKFEDFLNHRDKDFSLNILLGKDQKLPLTCASKEVFKRLVKMDEIDLNLTDTKKETAMHYFLNLIETGNRSENHWDVGYAIRVSKEKVGVLIEKGADLQRQNKDGITAIGLAIIAAPELAEQMLVKRRTKRRLVRSLKSR